MKNHDFETRMKNHGEIMRNAIEAPFDIAEKIEETERKNMKKQGTMDIFKRTLYTAAGTAAAFVLIFNCVPRLAFAARDIPIIGTAVKIVTLGRFEVDNGNYTANVVTPKIEGLLDKELEEKLNKEFKENADAVIAAFESDVKELKENYGEDGFHMGVDSAYTVRTDNEDILAIDCYIVNMAGSSSTTHKFYTIEKKTGKLLKLEDLFEKNADYVSPVSEYILGEMKKANESGNGYFWIDEEMDGFENFKKIKPDQNFFVNDAGNAVICFDKYEVAAGAQGCPEFEIPHSVVKDILKRG